MSQRHYWAERQQGQMVVDCYPQLAGASEGAGIWPARVALRIDRSDRTWVLFFCGTSGAWVVVQRAKGTPMEADEAISLYASTRTWMSKRRKSIDLVLIPAPMDGIARTLDAAGETLMGAEAAR